MVESRQSAFKLTGTYVHLDDDGGATAIDVTGGFWTELMAGDRRYDGRLVTAFEVTEDMAHWEMHPAGDESICLFSGAVSVVLEEAGDVQVVELGAGSACIVPSGVWHRLLVREPGRVLFVTPGEGTQHRAL